MSRFGIHRALWSSCCFGIVAGCGGAISQQPGSAQAPASSRNEEASPAQTEASESPPAASDSATAPERPGPAQFTIEAKVHGKVVAAKVRVLGPDGAEVAQGSSGQPLGVQSGQYQLEVQINEATALLDRPTQQRPLTLHAGDDLHEDIEFPWAMIQLNVVVNGNPDPNATVKLMRGGSDVGSVKSGAEPVAISPGRYEAEATSHGAKIKVQGLLFPEGATQSVPVRVQL